MISLEIVRETNRLTRTKAKNHFKLLIILGCSLSAFLTFLFFVSGVIQADPLYKDLPSIVSAPIVAISSFNAVLFTSLALLFVKSFGEISASKVISSFEARNNAKIEAQAEAITGKVLDKYGKKDYSLQIDEVKQGLQYQIDEQDIQIKTLKENDESKNHVIADNNRTIFDLKYRIKELENKIAKKQNTVPLEEYERILQELLETKEELRKLKGE